MCLSPEVDIAAGLVITGFAVDALRHVRNGRTLPLAMLPAVFAFHTFTSAFVWFGFEGVVPQAVGDAAANVFMFFAFVFFPIWVPVSILALEPRGWRRDAMLALSGAGVVSGLLFAEGLIRGSGSAVECPYYIDYQVVVNSPFAAPLYLIATVGPMLLSGQRPLLYWGIANAVILPVLSIWAARGLPSLWCFWAACTSFFVSWYLRRLDRERKAGAPWPWDRPPGADGREVLPQDAAVR